MGTVIAVLMITLAPQIIPVKNPRGVAFTCPDHDTDTVHEIAIVRESDGVTIQTIQGGDPPLSGTEVVVLFNVQPVAFGRYRFKVRAGDGTLWSDWSEPSDLWERAPGKATDLRVIAK